MWSIVSSINANIVTSNVEIEVFLIRNIFHFNAYIVFDKKKNCEDYDSLHVINLRSDRQLNTEKIYCTRMYKFYCIWETSEDVVSFTSQRKCTS